ncbi:MAG: hypothetical protein J3R72DRAFT_426966 [Linnemannia gamsii]|nr:MAG: hypothetical protein J3R72DRAFT_426966 [Linnemannia gamsii]
MQRISKFKPVPLDVRLYAKAQFDLYNGSFRDDVVAIARDQAQSEINRSLFRGKEQLISQRRYKEDLEVDLNTSESSVATQSNSLESLEDCGGIGQEGSDNSSENTGESSGAAQSNSVEPLEDCGGIGQEGSDNSSENTGESSVAAQSNSVEPLEVCGSVDGNFCNEEDVGDDDQELPAFARARTSPFFELVDSFSRRPGTKMSAFQTCRRDLITPIKKCFLLLEIFFRNQCHRERNCQYALANKTSVQYFADD